jgi:hypothetical protein
MKAQVEWPGLCYEIPLEWRGFLCGQRLDGAPEARIYINVVRNYARDEGWPLGAGLQEQASNHLKVLW